MTIADYLAGNGPDLTDEDDDGDYDDEEEGEAEGDTENDNPEVTSDNGVDGEKRAHQQD